MLYKKENQYNMSSLKKWSKPGMVAYACNPCTLGG